MKNRITPCLLLVFLIMCIESAEAGSPFLTERGGMQLADIHFQDKPKKKTRSYKTKTRPKVIPHKVEQYEIEGYMDKQYVRVVLEVENQERIVGNIYDKSGKGIYVHGEYQEGALYVYDDEGTEYQIVVE